MTQIHAILFLKSVKQNRIFSKHLNDKKFWEEKRANLTIQVQQEMTQEIRRKNCKLDSGKSHA